MSDVDQPRAKGTNIALIVSVCLNLILVGLIVTAVVRIALFHPMFGSLMAQHPPGRGIVVQQVLSMRALMHAAPAERAKLRAVAVAHRDRVKALRQEALDARQDVLNRFSQPDFDPAAFDAAVKRMHEADSALESEVLKIMYESAVTLTPEERQAVVQQYKDDDGPWRWRRRGGGGDRGPGPHGDGGQGGGN